MLRSRFRHCVSCSGVGEGLAKVVSRQREFAEVARAVSAELRELRAFSAKERTSAASRSEEFKS